MHAGNQPIDSIGFSTRVTNVLCAVGVTRLDELARFEERDLYRLPNLGKKSIHEIREVLETLERISEFTEGSVARLMR